MIEGNNNGPSPGIQSLVTSYEKGEFAKTLAMADSMSRRDGDNASVLNIAAACLIGMGKAASAEMVLRKAIAFDPGHAESYGNLGNVLRELKRYEESEAAYRRALEIRPEDAELHCKRGSSLRQLKRYGESETSYRRALAIQPEYVDAHNNLGNLFQELNRYEQAEAAYGRALAIQPDHAEANSNLGSLLHRMMRFGESEVAYRRALAVRPQFALNHNNLGYLLQDLKRYEESEAAYRRALAISPDYAEALYNLGNLLQERNRYEESEAAYRHALEIRPGFAEAHSNLGNLLAKLKRYEESEAAYRRALAPRPADTEILNSLGNLLMAMERYDESERVFRRALAIRPGYPEARLNLGLIKLSSGELREGWDLFEARFDPQMKLYRMKIPNLPVARWNGEAVSGKSLLIWPEQGYGDEIQFVRYVPILKAMGAARITLVCKSPLKVLFETLSGADSVVAEEDAGQVPAHDYWTFPVSIPRHLGTELASIPGALPYLSATHQYLDAWRPRLSGEGFKIGLIWKGRVEHANDRNRSLESVSLLRPLWSVPGVSFFSLQKGQDEGLRAPQGQPLRDLGREIRDFADAAAIISQLDLTICVDTAFAHLAGALGKPCWVLLPRFQTDWRWLRNRTDSPWYPRVMRLFRQCDQDDWSKTIAAVAEELHLVVSGSR